MRILMLGALAAGALLLASCESSRDRADQAYVQEDWDSAVEEYTKALGRATDPDDVAVIKERLHQAHLRGSEEHLEKAESLLAVGSTAGAFRHANLAFQYNPTPKTQALFTELKAREGDRLLRVGRSAVSNKKWLAAVSALEKAQAVARTEEGASLLNQARSEVSSQFSERLGLARGQLSSRAWQEAVASFGVAHEYGRTDQSEREHAFAVAMVDAEAAAQSWRNNRFAAASALLKYEHALTFDMDTAYVRTRVERMTPGDYRVTLHSAVILPFKPQSKKPWDGTGGVIPGADVLMNEAAAVGGFAGPQGVVFAKLGEIVLTNGGTAPPDCYVVMTLDGQQLGGRDNHDQDELQPQWDLSFALPQTTRADPRMISISVRDRDFSEDDNVGSFQVTVGELLESDGTLDLTFIDPGGELKAGGILAVRFSSRRID